MSGRRGQPNNNNQLLRRVCGGEAVPQGVLPATDNALVITGEAVPVDAVFLVGGGEGHHDAAATAMSQPSPTAYTRRIIEVGGGVDHDAREVLGQQARATGHRGERAGRRQVVSKIDDPGVSHQRRERLLWVVLYSRPYSRRACRFPLFPIACAFLPVAGVAVLA
jgi:hypothetical protein